MTMNFYADICPGFGPDDAILHAAPLSHGSGLYALPNLAKGATNVILESRSFDPELIFKTIQDFRVTNMFAAPTMIRMMIESPAVDKYDHTSMKALNYGGAPMLVEDLKRAMAKLGPCLVQLYGQAESPMTITYLPHRDHVSDGAPEQMKRLASAGFSRTDVEVRIFDLDDRELPPGETGEIVTRSDQAGSPAPGFAFDFAIPSDHIKTQAIYRVDTSTGLEKPVDVREHDGIWSANIDNIRVRYLSSDALDDTTKYSALFMETLGAWLGIGLQDGANKEEVWRSRLVEALRLEAIEQSAWLPYQLDGRYFQAVRHIGELANWKFALETQNLTDGAGTPVPGFTNDFSLPNDYLRTQAIFVRSNEREYPVDVRHSDGILSANVSPITIRFVSLTNLTDPANLSIRFIKCVGAWLGIEVLPDGSAAQAGQGPLPLFSALLEDAKANEAIPDDDWLVYQLDGRFQRAARYILECGFWRWALKTDTRADQSGFAVPGFTNDFTIPSDHIKTQAIFNIAGTREVPIDVRESNGIWSADTTTITVRYLSRDVLATPTAWSDKFLGTLAAYLSIGLQPNVNHEEVWRSRLKESLATEAIEQSPWLVYQLDGRFRQAAQTVLEFGLWRHFMETLALSDSGSGTPAPGYSFNFVKPSGYIKTQAFFKRDGTRECPIDFRESDGQFSANYATPTIRFVSTDNLDAPVDWPMPFLTSVGAFLGIIVSPFGEAKVDTKGVLNWRAVVADALAHEGIQESPWLRFQRDGSFYRVMRDLLAKGFWRFALKTVSLSSARGVELLSNPKFTSDTVWNKGIGWTIHSGAAHKAAGVQDSLTQSATLAEGLAYEVTFTVSNHVAGSVTPRLTGGSVVTGTARTGNGTYTETLTAVSGNNTVGIQASSTFAGDIDNVSVKQVIVTAPPSPGYAYAFEKPADWVRTFHVYSPVGNDGLGQRRCDIPFRDEVDPFDGTSRISANEDPIVLRYVSSDGEDSATWSDAFEQAVLTCLQYEEAKNLSGVPVSRMQALTAAWDDALRRARSQDDMTERPPVNQTGRLVQARRGGSGRLYREQGLN